MAVVMVVATAVVAVALVAIRAAALAKLTLRWNALPRPGCTTPGLG